MGEVRKTTAKGEASTEKEHKDIRMQMADE